MSVQSWSSSRFSTCSSDRPSFAGSARWKRKKSLPADSSRATSDSLLRRSSVLPMRWMPCANTSFTRSPVSMIMSKLWRRPLLAKEEDEADAPAAFTLPAATVLNPEPTTLLPVFAIHPAMPSVRRDIPPSGAYISILMMRVFALGLSSDDESVVSSCGVGASSSTSELCCEYPELLLFEFDSRISVHCSMSSDDMLVMSSIVGFGENW
uniref:Uncharacterized protein n=1 Tax=Anopheles christyi TaxID=43041 RepID=A0A182KIE7_9DIPT